MTDLGAVITAIVTPFDQSGAVDEQSFVALMGYVAANGSDGFVVAGTTGEASTLSEREHLNLIELAVAERPAGKTMIAGTGTNDTAQAVNLTERATALGADAMLVVTPYYNRPSRLGLLRHYEAVAAATDKPIILYNIPGRTGDEHAARPARRARADPEHRRRQAGERAGAAADRGLELYAGDDSSFARTLELGGAGGILVASHIVGPQMRRMVDEPASARQSTPRCTTSSTCCSSPPTRPRSRPR